MNKPVVLGVSTAKGGSSKSFTAIVLAHLLSTSAEKGLKREAKKVLFVDMDFQGDATENLTKMDQDEFEGRSVFEAIQGKDVNECIHKVNGNLSILPATSDLALLDKYIYEKNIRHSSLLLKEAIHKVEGDYDYIIIDTSPSLSKGVILSLAATEKLIIPMQTQKFGYRAVSKFSNTVLEVNQSINSELELLGILPVMVETQKGRMDMEVLEQAKEDYGDYMFSTIIRRRSTLNRLINHEGFSDKYAKQRESLQDYYSLYQEVIERVQRA
ncbi:AAA family ATPase [Bacillus cereus]|uniref:ParA family protein n=1 Tax=Bacillus cereus TaxID=1396 RepID=UPI0014830651|nr:ParA family protein [Bacillus cereus]